MAKRSRKGCKPTYATKRGRIFVGHCEKVLERSPLTRVRGKVQLLFTSPPFALNTKKKYGNLQGDDYIRWFESLAPVFREMVKPDGSIVIELGNAWLPGQPTMSTLTVEALLAFKRAANLHLCQEFICFNPAKLPTPAEWVTVRRVRVKDAFTRLWWMSPSPNPKADNRRVLTKYSDSMVKLLEKGTYNSGTRPSEHRIGRKSFLRNQGGAIPPNVLISPQQLLPDLIEVLPIANTKSDDPCQVFCRNTGALPHPARMPQRLAEFFIEFLTEPGDLVLDPFAGSNTTGAAAEELRRKWIAIEASKDYVRLSRARFSGKVAQPRRRRASG